MAVDHRRNQEGIDDPPDDADDDEIAQNLQDRRQRPAKVEAVERQDAEEEPKDLGQRHALLFIGHARLDEHVAIKFASHRNPPCPRGGYATPPIGSRQAVHPLARVVLVDC